MTDQENETRHRQVPKGRALPTVLKGNREMNKDKICPECGSFIGVKFDTLTNVRPPVALFAREMEDVLRANDFKGGWGKDECTPDFLRMKLIENLGKYAEAQRVNDSYRAQKCLVDVANYAMMLWDRSKYGG